MTPFALALATIPPTEESRLLIDMLTPMASTIVESNLKAPEIRGRWKRRVFSVGAGLLLLYAMAFAGFDFAMHQPPESFSTLMMHVGPVPFLLFPFETMWKDARRGRLKVGDTAPDFTLPLLDRSNSVTLSSLRGKQPVVLVFGSYT